jgi:hypothetical protein
MPYLYCHESIQDAIVLSLKIANVFNIPVIATEHNPKAFGKIIPDITNILPGNHPIIEKL